MKNTILILMLRLINLAGLAFASVGVAMAQPLVSVSVYAEHYGGKLVYHYSAVNNSPNNIVAVSIGRDNKNDNNPNNDVWELNELPTGWDFNSGIPSGSATSPPGWRVDIITPEETATHAIAWRAIDGNSPRLLPSKTLTGMSVTLDKADTNYLSAHALFHFTNSYPTRLTVPIERLDTTPPAFTVTLSPSTLHPNDKHVPITATITVKDDYDPAPEIKLESITPSEMTEPGDIRDASLGTDDRQFMLKAESKGKNKSGRIYTVIYSATDASGNQSIATATVTVSHDKREHEDSQYDKDKKDKNDRDDHKQDR